jgi:hypothetical protein
VLAHRHGVRFFGLMAQRHALSCAFFSPGSRPRNRQHGGMFMCTACGVSWTIPSEARSRKVEGEKGRIVGLQPAICERCSQPFRASRLGHRFCSTSCRVAAWRWRYRVARGRSRYRSARMD